MLVQVAHLWRSFGQARAARTPLVLAMITRTLGSTYKKTGAMMLIDEGRPDGLLSGGCLEADIASHAAGVLDTGKPRRLNYDLGDDSPFGLRLGCRGQVEILLLKLSPDEDYRPFSLLDPTPEGARNGTLVVGVAANDPATLGQYAYRSAAHTAASSDLAKQWLNAVPAQDCATPSVRLARPERLVLAIRRPPRVLVLGAGPDVPPLVTFASSMYWHLDLFDHRRALLEPSRFPPETRLHEGRPDRLSQHLTLDDCDAAVIMSHNIDHDIAYLRQLARAPIPYIGLLGPPARRDQVVAKAGLPDDMLGDRLHGPAGLPLGGHLPESIALSIVTEIHQHLFLAQPAKCASGAQAGAVSCTQSPAMRVHNQEVIRH
jgi:xanthine dehydrogenase accessory factor